MPRFPIEALDDPALSFRVDTFAVPEAARADLELAMRRSMDFVRTLPGFRGHVALEKRAGPASFDLMTVAAWESPEALERAGHAVRAHHRAIGLDLPALLAAWGVRMERGDFTAPGGLQGAARRDLTPGTATGRGARGVRGRRGP